jgi:hypothetical protein
MKETKILIENIEKLQVPATGFSLIKINEKKYFGKNSDGEIVFAMPVSSKEIHRMSQRTQSLKLFINRPFLIIIESSEREESLSGLILSSKDVKHIELFVRLTFVLANDTNENKLLKHFLTLKYLFSNTQKVSETALQGLYGELLAMYIMQKNGVNISKYYQRIDRLKYDFSVTDKKKIEVKTTKKPTRIHHFLQQQLDTERYDIKILSIMLQRDDAGMSLYDLVEECKELFAHNFELIIRIETMVANIEDEDLKKISFNYEYSRNNFRLFDAYYAPRLKEKNEDGVFNVEYDVDFTNVLSMKNDEFINWLRS